MLKYSFKPEKCMARTQEDMVVYLNKQLLAQNTELRRVLDSACRDIEELKKEVSRQ